MTWKQVLKGDGWLVPHPGCLGRVQRLPEHSHAAGKQRFSSPGVPLDLCGGDRSVGLSTGQQKAAPGRHSQAHLSLISPHRFHSLFPHFSCLLHSLSAMHPKLSAPASLPLHPSLLPPLLALSSRVPAQRARSFSSGVNPSENKLIIRGKVAPFSVPTPVSHLISLSASSILLLCACLLPLSGLCSG